MNRSEWSPPSPAPTDDKARPSAAESPPAVALWYSRFALNLAFFGLVGALVGSWFPLCLGAFLFFTDENFIESGFQALGIRLIPDSFGSVFIKSLVFLIGIAALIVYWKDAAPAWLSSQLPAGSPPWALIAGIALLIGLLSTASAWLMKLMLPEIARNSLTWTVTRGGFALCMFGMVMLFTYALGPL
jgi:hypothetical protein